jgi:hypothetical protein
MENASYFISNRGLFGCFPSQKNVDELICNGVRYFINLTFVDEKRITPYILPRSCKRINYPIKDHNTPKNLITFSSFIYKISNILENLQPPHKVYIHCRGGHGRAGMVVAILLCHVFNITPEASLIKTAYFHSLRPAIKAKWRAIGSPHIYRQRAFVYSYFETFRLYRLQYKSQGSGSSYGGLSRFTPIIIVYKSIKFLSIEGALLYSIRPIIKYCGVFGKSAFDERTELKKYGAENPKVIRRWKETRKSILFELYMLLLETYPAIKRFLLRTAFRPLFLIAKGNSTWPLGDGDNVAGKTLMDIRSQFYHNNTRLLEQV